MWLAGVSFYSRCYCTYREVASIEQSWYHQNHHWPQTSESGMFGIWSKARKSQKYESMKHVLMFWSEYKCVFTKYSHGPLKQCSFILIYGNETSRLALSSANTQTCLFVINLSTPCGGCSTPHCRFSTSHIYNLRLFAWRMEFWNG